MDNDFSNIFEKFNIDKNSISPEMVSNLMSMLNNSSNNSENTQANNYSQGQNNNPQSNIDFDTILRMKKIIDQMDLKDDPRSRLLTSLKPYLKESRRSKVDQYVQLMNMSKVMESFNLFSGDNKNASK